MSCFPTLWWGKFVRRCIVGMLVWLRCVLDYVVVFILDVAWVCVAVPWTSGQYRK